jgi:hypothetical protein
MTYAIGRGVRVEIGMTESAAVTLTEVSEAKPPVATTSVAHGLAVKSLAYVSVATGMPRLEGQAVRFSAAAGSSLTFEDLDTTTYGNFTAGTLIPIATWGTLGSTTDYNKAGGESNPLDVTVLLDEIQQQENGQLSAESVAFTLRTETISGAAMQKIRETARVNGYLVFRLTLKDGNVRYFRGQPSLPTEQVGQGAVGVSTFSVTLKQLFLEGAA